MGKVWVLQLWVMCSLCISSCSFAPPYNRPELVIPKNYKEKNKWVQAKPSSALERGPWWEMYRDPILNKLEACVSVNNQNLAGAAASYEEAQSIAKVARAELYPTIIGAANDQHARTSATVANRIPHREYNDALLVGTLTYDLDLWGRVRNTIAAANHNVVASADDLIALKLSLQTELAIDYFSLRSADEAQRVLDETVKTYAKSLQIVKQRFHGGVAGSLEVDQAETQLNTARTKAADMHLTRAQLEHAIALLIGQTASSFSLPVTQYSIPLITIDPSLPSTLLERRPDIAAAEHRVYAANATIGVTRAAFFPDINLTTALGSQSQSIPGLFQVPSIIWSLGASAVTLFASSTKPLLNQTIFDGGRLLGLNERSWAIYWETVAQYRQTVLAAFKEVEDSLVALRQLDVEIKTQKQAYLAAKRAVQQSWFQYQGGLTIYLNVALMQIIVLQSQLDLIHIRTRRHLASVQLIHALGGGWTCSSQVYVHGNA